MQRLKCGPDMVKVSKGSTLRQPQAAAVDWFLQLLPSGLLHWLRFHESSPDASGLTGGSAKGTESSGKRADTGLLKSHPVSGFSTAPALLSGPKANDVPSLTCPLPDPNPEVVNDYSARECRRGDSVYVDCVSAFWKVLFEPPLNSNSTEQRVASFWFLGSWRSWAGALQHGPDDSNTRDKKEATLARGDTLAMQVAAENLCPANEFLEKGKPDVRREQPKGKTGGIQNNREHGQKMQTPYSAALWQQLGEQQRRHQELLIKEQQRQQRPEELFFEPVASWAFFTNFCQFMFSSCFGHQTPLQHEGLEGPEELQENEDTAAFESCERTMWSETNLQLVCGTRCRSLRRVKDEGRQVWMEYQEVTLLDNSRRFQWVELAENGTAATE